jgi:transposase
MKLSRRKRPVCTVFRNERDPLILGEWVEPSGKRRYRPKEERRQIVEETLQPGASVAVIARPHGVNANQVFHWRKLYREGRLDAPPPAQLLPVREPSSALPV